MAFLPDVFAGLCSKLSGPQRLLAVKTRFLRFLSKVCLGTEIAALCHVMRGVCLVLAALWLVGCYPQMLDVRSNSTGDSKNTSAEEETSKLEVFRGFSCQPGASSVTDSSFIKRTREEVLNRFEVLLSQMHRSSSVHLTMWTHLQNEAEIQNRLTNERSGQYDRMTGSPSYSFEFLQSILFVIGDLVESLSQGSNWSAWRTSFAGACSTQMNPSSSCLEEFLTKLFSKSFPQGFSEQLFNETLAAMLGSYQDDPSNPKRDWLRIALIAALMDARSIYRFESGQEGQASSQWKPLTDVELAARLTSIFWTSVPDDQIQTWVEEKKIRSHYDQVLNHIFNDPKFYSTMSRFADQWLKLNEMRQVDFSASPAMIDRRERLGASQIDLSNFSEEAKQEARTFFVELLKQDLSFSDLFLSDASYAAGSLAQLQGLTPWSSNSDQVARDRAKKSGLLTLPALHLNNGTDKSHIHVGYFVFKNLLCMQTPSPESAGVSTDDLTLPHAQMLSSSRERTEALVAEPLCQSCHQKFDHLGFALSSIDPWGVKRQTELVYNGTTHEFLGEVPINSNTFFSIAGGKGQAVSNPRDLGQALINSKYPQACFTRQFYRFSFGREEALSGEEACALQALYSSLSDQSQSLKDALKEFAKSRFFMERYSGEAM